MTDYDVIVLGAGPAASSAAVTCAVGGMKVLMADRYPEDVCKPCGDGLSENGLEALAKLSVSADRLLKAGAHPISRSVHLWPGWRSEVRHDDRGFLTLPKPCLLRLVRSRAEEAGARIRYAAETPVQRDGLWQIGDTARAPRLIDASGAQSGFRQDPALRRGLPIGASMVISAKPPLDEDSVWFWHLPDDPSGYRWAFPLGDRRWNIGVWRSTETARIKAEMERFIALCAGKCQDHFAVIRPAAYAFLGTSPTSRADQAEDGCLQAGDAAGTCDASSGEGIPQAVASGMLAAETCLRGAERSSATRPQSADQNI